MDLYEYQARELLEEQGIPTPKAIFAQNSHEVAEAADQIGYPNVIKAQVKIGHRGQAGGVKLAKTRDESILASEDILPMTIHKHKVSGVLVAEAKNILHEYYVSISVDRSSRDFDVLATANGGTEVEEIAKEHPESVKRLHIDALDDFDLEAATKMAESIGFYHADVDQAAQILLKMWRCFKENDATLVEINPLAKIGDPIVGTTLQEALEAFENDEATKAVVMIGEIGGSAEQDAAKWASEHMTKPVVAYIAGFTAPEGKQMGHAGAIVSGGKGTAQDKKEALEAVGIRVGRTPGQTAEIMREVLASQSL